MGRHVFEGGEATVVDLLLAGCEVEGDGIDQFIADGSSLPTGGVNPTLTIQAVALRCAERIWERRTEWQ